MYRIAKRFYFAAAHSLPSLPPDHKCHRMHGHNYMVELIIESSDVDENGMVLDYGEMGSGFGRWVKETLDHRTLDDLMTEGADHEYVPNRSNAPEKMVCVKCQTKHEPVPATAENLARILHAAARILMPPDITGVKVRVAETEGTWAEYE